jgi:hypothetical protein
MGIYIRTSSFGLLFGLKKINVTNEKMKKKKIKINKIKCFGN